jgi:hypothetical protein
MSDKFKKKKVHRNCTATAQIYSKTGTVSDQEIKCFGLEIMKQEVSSSYEF